MEVSSNGKSPIAGWFISWKIQSTNGWFGWFFGAPLFLANHQPWVDFFMGKFMEMVDSSANLQRAAMAVRDFFQDFPGFPWFSPHMRLDRKLLWKIWHSYWTWHIYSWYIMIYLLKMVIFQFAMLVYQRQILYPKLEVLNLLNPRLSKITRFLRILGGG